MFKHNSFEAILGALIILCAVGFLVFVRLQTGIGGLSSYEMNAVLGRADGLTIGTDVKIAGVKIGRVTDLSLEPRTYRVRARMEIRSGIPIPADSYLAVSGGTMSSPYLSLSPGRSKRTVLPGDTLRARP